MREDTKWVDEIKHQALLDAEWFIKIMKMTAEHFNVEHYWYIEKVVNNIHKMKDREE